MYKRFIKCFGRTQFLVYYEKTARWFANCELQVANLNPMTASYGNIVTSFIYCTISQRASRPIHLVSW